MIIINLLIVILVPFVFGLLLFSALINDEQPEIGSLEASALAFSIGLGGVTIIMYLLSLLNFSLTLMNILAVVVGISVLLAVFCRKPATKRRGFPPLDWQEWLLTGLIFIKIVFVFFSALVKPVIDIDAILYYSIVAKGI